VARAVHTMFTRYEFTEQEVPMAFVFTELQTQHLQNELTIAAEAQVALQLDPLNPMARIQEEAYNRGKIDMLRYLLTTSESTKEAQQQLAGEVAASQALEARTKPVEL
jgi:hypothetical protein